MTVEVLELLYLMAIKHEKIGGERFERNLRRLLKQYLHNLKPKLSMKSNVWLPSWFSPAQDS